MRNVIQWNQLFSWKGDRWKLERFSWNDTEKQVLRPWKSLERREKEKKREGTKNVHPYVFKVASSLGGTMTSGAVFKNLGPVSVVQSPIKLILG